MRIDEDIAIGEFWSLLRRLDFAFNWIFLFTLQILLNEGMMNAQIIKHLVVEGLSSLHFKGFSFGLVWLVCFFFSHVMYAHICYVEEYSCCPLNHLRPVIKICSLQLPLAEIRARARPSSFIASFQLEHKQHTSSLDTEQRRAEHRSRPHSSLGWPCRWGNVSKFLIAIWRAGVRTGREASVSLLLEHWLYG